MLALFLNVVTIFALLTVHLDLHSDWYFETRIYRN